jgi:predicted nucleic acid-binding protein
MTSSLVCVDASLIVRALVPGPFTDTVLALMDAWRRDRTSLIAPALLAFEVTSVLRRCVYLGEISPRHGERAFDAFCRIDLRLSHRQGIFPLAWELAKQFDRPRAYDTAYLAYARLNDCTFWTADEKLYNAVRRELDWVRWIGDSP